MALILHMFRSIPEQGPHQIPNAPLILTRLVQAGLYGGAVPHEPLIL